MSSAAFMTPLPVNPAHFQLRSTSRLARIPHHRTPPSSSPVTCPRLSLASALPKSKPRAPSPSRSPAKANRGKRVATYRKLQTRHRAGPSVFRQNAETLITKDGIITKEKGRVPERRPFRNRRDAIPLRDLKVGQKFTGVVHNIVRHGAYVDIGAKKDGLVHLRDMSVDFVHEVEDIVRPDDTLTVWIKYVDPVSHVLALTMLPPALGFDAPRLRIADIPMGLRVKAVVQRVTNFGAYVDAGFERHAFVHVRRLWGTNPSDTLQNLRLGQELNAEVVHVDEVRSYVSLTARGKRGVKLNLNVSIDKDVEQAHPGSMIDMDQDTVRSMAVLRLGEEVNDGFQTGTLQHDNVSENTITGDEDIAGEDDVDSDADDNGGVLELVDTEFRDDIDVEALTAQLDSDEVDDNDDDDDDEFAFADEMGAVKGFVEDDGPDYSEIAHMLTDDTEFIGLESNDLAKLKQVRTQLEAGEDDEDDEE